MNSEPKRADPLLSVSDIQLQFGGLRVLASVSFAVERGEIFSIIGPNGAGKTSLLNCISGRYQPDSGSILFDHTELTRCSINARAALGLGRTFQNLALFEHMSVLDNVLVGRHHLMRSNVLDGIFYWLGRARTDEARHRQVVLETLEKLDLMSVADSSAGVLSYGLQKRVELARAMALQPSLILLDEPMAGMNREEKDAMARQIIDLNVQSGLTVVMIEHDVGIVREISDRVIVLDFGEKIAEGEPETVLQDSHVREAYLGMATESAHGV
ncbi:MAG: ABC transporter ATP-binding protein [Ketobacteraceae bacterium]|nr:ABC transporter ATP-binding protein [Ketobacteraceae bacterium]